MTGMDGRVQGAVLFKDQSQTRQLWRCHCKKKAKTWTQMQVAERFKKKGKPDEYIGNNVYY